MSTTAKASDHVKPCNIEQSERHNRRDAEYIASLNPRILYVRTDLSPNNESYVAPNMQGITLQQHYDAIKAMVKQKTGRAMQEKKVMVTGKNGKPKERNGSSPIRESVVNIKSGTTMHDLLKYTDKVHEGGASEPYRYTSTRTKATMRTLMIQQRGSRIFMHTLSGTG